MTLVPLENWNERNLAVPRAARICGNCWHFEANTAANPKSGEARQGWCVASPPVAMPGIAQGLAGPQQVMQGVWPPTLASKRCGAWTPEDAA
jgi:hypothetical protein